MRFQVTVKPWEERGCVRRTSRSAESQVKCKEIFNMLGIPELLRLVLRTQPRSVTVTLNHTRSNAQACANRGCVEDWVTHFAMILAQDIGMAGVADHQIGGEWTGPGCAHTPFVH